jgi:hypothetical protein
VFVNLSALLVDDSFREDASSSILHSMLSSLAFDCIHDCYHLTSSTVSMLVLPLLYVSCSGMQ